MLVEIDELASAGLIRKAPDGRWRPVARSASAPPPPPSAESAAPIPSAGEGVALHAAPMRLGEEQIGDTLGVAATGTPDPARLLRYFQAALRDDPRGATTETPERHGALWHLVHGAGRLTPQDAGQRTILHLSTASLQDAFRRNLLRREGEDQGLALGWPIAVGVKNGVPAIYPVGLIPARWRREGETLRVEIEADNVFANPDWLHGAARGIGWNLADLARRFEGEEGVGLPLADFRDRLREAAAGPGRRKLGGGPMAAWLDASEPGLHDIAALFLPAETTFTQGAVRDLGTIVDWPEGTIETTALGALLGAQGAAPAEAPAPTIGIGPLNAEQIEAARAAQAERLTIVSGPPGTGKSQAIVAMAASALADGQRVLVASKNHQALDAVEERLGGIATDVAFLVRTLDPATGRDFALKDVLTELLNEAPRHAAPADPEAVAALHALAARRLGALDAIKAEEKRRIEMADLVDQIALREGRAEVVPPPAAPRLSFIARLIAWLLRRKEAVDPVRDLSAELRSLEAELATMRADAPAVPEDPVALGDQIAEAAGQVLPRILASRTTLSDAERDALSAGWGAHRLAGDRGHPPAALAADTIEKRPLWLASVLGAPKRIPLTPGLFDLLIIDEASQCDVASALPLFARARRAVVVGDAKQLGCIPQLGLARDRRLMEAAGIAPAAMGRLAQSQVSLFDAARDAPGTRRITLRDQYRSAPEIVAYLNDQFYGGALRVAGDEARLRPPAGMRPGVTWTHVAAPAAPVRENVNHPEIAAIAAHLRVLLEEQGYDGSVGVISPFRAQAQALNEAIRDAVSTEAAARVDLRVATVDSFQGQERDLILFSPCLGATSPQSAVGFVSKDWRRLNVAISRARAVAHVFGDERYAKSGAVRSLARLAEFATIPRRPPAEGVFDSEWERRVDHALKARGLAPHPQYAIAGRRLDFALFGKTGVKLDLEVDGRRWHMTTDGTRKRSDLWRDHQLRSMGWKVRRFWVDELAKDMEGCLDLVERDLAG